jgi:hypothetical protein
VLENPRRIAPNRETFRVLGHFEKKALCPGALPENTALP